MLEEKIAFGEKICRMREDMGMTQDQLAEKLGKCPKQLSKYENGHVEMGGMLFAQLVELHAEKMKQKSEDLLQRIMKLSATDRAIIEQMVDRMTCG